MSDASRTSREYELWAMEAQARAIQCEELLLKAQAELAAAEEVIEKCRLHITDAEGPGQQETIDAIRAHREGRK